MFSKLSLQARILTLGIFLCSVSLVVGFLSFRYLHEVKSEYAFLPEKVMPKLEHMNDMYLNYRRLRIVVRTLGIPGLSQAQAEEALKEVSHIIEEYESHDKAYTALGFLPGQKELYDKVHATWLEFRKVGEEAVALYKTGTPENHRKMIQIFLTTCPDKAKEYTNAIHALEVFHKDTAHKKSELAGATSKKATQATVIVNIVGIIIGLTLSLLLSKALSSALAKISQDVGSATRQTSDASAQLALASERLSSSSSETASSLEEIVASLEEISSMVKLNSKNAQQASEVAQTSQQTVQQGEAEVSKLIAAMNDMAESSKKIEDITNVIDEIAFQTNLLALNAAVEAARAGDQGRGFAVVADAVRALAHRSAEAAKDIAALIKQTVSKSQNGAHIAGASQKVLIEILSATNKVVALNREIATGTQEQSNGIQQISIAMNQLDQATQSNTASAVEVSSASEEMASQAEALSMLVQDLQALVNGQKKNAEASNKVQVSKPISILNKTAA